MRLLCLTSLTCSSDDGLNFLGLDQLFQRRRKNSKRTLRPWDNDILQPACVCVVTALDKIEGRPKRLNAGLLFVSDWDEQDQGYWWWLDMLETETRPRWFGHVQRSEWVLLWDNAANAGGLEVYWKIKGMCKIGTWLAVATPEGSRQEKLKEVSIQNTRGITSGIHPLTEMEGKKITCLIVLSHNHMWTYGSVSVHIKAQDWDRPEAACLTQDSSRCTHTNSSRLFGFVASRLNIHNTDANVVTWHWFRPRKRERCFASRCCITTQ